MANHKSAIKRIKTSLAKQGRNKYLHKTARTYIKRIKTTNDLKEAQELLPKVVQMPDKLAKRNIIHKNKSANLKSSIARHVASLK